MLFLDYLPAESKFYKSGWYVVYHVKNPQTKKLQRKLIRVNRIENPIQRKRFIQKLIVEINSKLQTGWNPFIEQEAPRAYTKLVDALDIYLRAKKKEFSSKDSIRTYQSQVEILKTYIIEIAKKPDILVISFDNYEVKGYMDYVYNVRDIGGCTFNNYKHKCITIWNWFIENLYCKANPFLIISSKMEKTKTRQIIDNETRKKIKDYLAKNNDYEFLSMILLCFHGFIRPKEICNLIPEYFNLGKKIIFLPAKITKNKKDRVVTLTDELLECLSKLNIDKIAKNLYVFSEKFKPGKKLINSRDVAKRWDKLRKELNLPIEFQFYSLKDSGIVQKLKDGISAIDVRDQAGHSSLEQTNQYAKYANPEGSEQIKNRSSEF